MVGIKDGKGIACRLERPQHVYIIECVEDSDRDGQYESFFLLNHDSPFLFSARRQPRHQKVFPIEPCVLKPGVKNIWGDKTVGRGCLPNVIVKDGDFPKRLQIYGRTLQIAAPIDGKVSVSMTAVIEDLAVEL